MSFTERTSLLGGGLFYHRPFDLHFQKSICNNENWFRQQAELKEEIISGLACQARRLHDIICIILNYNPELTIWNQCQGIRGLDQQGPLAPPQRKTLALPKQNTKSALGLAISILEPSRFLSQIFHEYGDGISQSYRPSQVASENEKINGVTYFGRHWFPIGTMLQSTDPIIDNKRVNFSALACPQEGGKVSCLDDCKQDWQMITKMLVFIYVPQKIASTQSCPAGIFKNPQHAAFTFPVRNTQVGEAWRKKRCTLNRNYNRPQLQKQWNITRQSSKIREETNLDTHVRDKVPGLIMGTRLKRSRPPPKMLCAS